jgi:hypothetical protein
MLTALRDKLLSFDRPRQIAVLVGAVFLLAGLVWGVGKMLFPEHLYHIHLEGSVQPPPQWKKLPPKYLTRMRFNVGLGGIRWMVRRDGSIWTRSAGKWQVMKRIAKFDQHIDNSGKYTIDIEVVLPYAPPTCNVRLHRRGCKAQQINVNLKRGSSRYHLVGDVGVAVLEPRPRRRSPSGSPTPRSRR